MKKRVIIRIVCSCMIIAKPVFAIDSLFRDCGKYEVSGLMDCSGPLRCQLSIWKGSLSEISYPITIDYDGAKVLNKRQVKTQAFVQSLIPFKIDIGGSYIPILREDMSKDIKLIMRERCKK